MVSQNPRNLPVRRFRGQFAQPPSLIGMKRGRAGRSISAPERQCRSPRCHQVISLPSRSEHCSSDESNESTIADEKIAAQHNSIPDNHLSPAQAIDLQQLLREEFSRWSDRIEYTAPPEGRLLPRKRFKGLQWDSGLSRAEEEEDSEDEFVVVSHPECPKAFLHLACPFFINAPEQYQQCLFKDDFDSIETLIKHLLRHHNRPLYCPTCRKTFRTLIERDDHALENACKRNTKEELDGLTENQKAKLIKRDRYYLGEAARWRCIWSTVFPDSEQPQSPYLDNGNGLSASMVKDFWTADGQRVVSGFLTGKDISTDENNAAYNTICHTAFETLMDWAFKQDSSSSSLTSNG
ncbi:hypothetical protein NW756_001694 [Fusarium oxysporum]|nr:hypothetical protein NW763_008409 [Fusarium oxysporum]WKT41925.1 hypothetical protein QSH57_006731 [Fusarium oxysporum f. sp. vasinfectum]KAJ4069368.1 hypothetical protein NW753_000248 [Fusarium oxysporum]KAJ4101283.1 hypothetical protein NW756_001694 [Fusarium oxysporum]KAJ4118302.1 hypothetical protein NW769_003105 [Fusarium oxysporum]